ncbi:hypothetical protein HPB47_002237, partial [Ixodes persulcatus]
PFSTTALGWHVPTNNNKSGLPVITDFKHRFDKALANNGPPVCFEHRRPRDINRPYLSAQHFGFVGFGAGTLADMHLTTLLVMQ